MKCCISICLCVATAFALAQTPSAKQGESGKVPVLVELFTSEGCSTCPPADNLLIRLKEQQPIPGVKLIALGFHVDYWDQKGWKDRFSSKAYTERQEKYATRLHEEVYTPQMVVDGVSPVQNGPDIPQIVAKTARAPKPVRVELKQQGANAELGIGADASQGEAFLALVEDGVETTVKGGENQGKTLHHAAVVRDWHSLGKISGNLTKTVPLNIPPGADRSRLQIVAFVQEPSTGRILGLQSIQLQ